LPENVAKIPQGDRRCRFLTPGLHELGDLTKDDQVMVKLAMGNQSTQQLVGALLDAVDAGSFTQVAKVVRLLSAAKPVSVKTVAESLGMTRVKTEKWLTDFNSEFDTKGDLIGLGLTMVPTQHVFQLGGKKLYTWCAGDTLLFPMMLGKSAHVESVDPISGSKVTLTATPYGVENLQPDSAVISWPTHPDGSKIRRTICDVSNYFASRETAEKYASSTKGVTVITKEEVRAIYRIIAERSDILAKI
jgi:alkylmercury lyase